MFELAAALAAGIGVMTAVIAVGLPPPDRLSDDRRSRLPLPLLNLWSAEAGLAAGSGWWWLDRPTFVLLQAGAGVACAAGAVAISGLPALAAAGAAGGIAVVRGVVSTRTRSRRAARQDAVLESVRMLRQLLETGAAGVPQALAVLGERGPLAIRHEFTTIAASTTGQRQAWAAARSRVAEPLFDLLAAAVQVQRPGGGELVPLFVELEASVSAAQEVEREAQALQVQARSAATIIVALPIAFLVILSSMHSPYLDAFHQPAGEAFLLTMLGVMAGSYGWMRRLLRLPGMQRVRLADG